MTSHLRAGAAAGTPPSAAAPADSSGDTKALPDPLAPAPSWITLASPGSGGPDDRPVQMRRVAAILGVAAFVVAVVVAVTGSVVSQRIAENQGVHDVAQMTDLLAENVIQPALTNGAATSTEQATKDLQPLVQNGLVSGSLVRVKLWAPSGQIMYSDEARLIGMTFALDPDARGAFLKPHTQAEVTDVQRPENVYDRGRGRLLEVYRPIWTPRGDPLLFETYFKYDIVTARSHQLWRGFGGIMLSSLAALILLLAPIVWLLLLNARRGRAHREELMKRALDASDEERRRIAASLHDGVVQQLAAASFAASGQAEQAAAAGDTARAEGLASVGATVRDSIAGLRSLLVDIYPASLHTSGLSVALRDLARTTSASTATVDAFVNDECADTLPVATQESVFRVAQEALRNAIRHSGATQLRLTLEPLDDRQATLEIEDNGRGFDVRTTADAATSHFGLRLMADAAKQCSGALEMRSAPGFGTAIRLTVGRG